MSTFAEDFDRSFRDALQRVFLKAHRQKINGKAHNQAEVAEHSDTVSIDDFHAFMPMHQYIFEPTGELWPASSINSSPPDAPRVRWRAVTQLSGQS
jgi:hypothetical protein